MAGCTSVGRLRHIPFCATRCDYCAFATWTDRVIWSTNTSTRASPTCAARRRRRADRGATVYFAGHSLAVAACADAHPRRHPACGEREVTWSATRLDRRREAGHLRDHGVTRVSSVCSRRRPRARRARAHARPRQRRARRRRDPRDRDRHSTSTSSPAPRGVRRRFDATMTDVLAFDRARERVRADGRPVRPWRGASPRASSPPDPDAQADRYLRADDRLAAAPRVTRCQLGPPGTSAGTTSDMVRRGLRGDRAAAHGTPAAPLVNAPGPSATSSGSPGRVAVAGRSTRRHDAAPIARPGPATRAGAPVAGAEPAALAESGLGWSSRRDRSCSPHGRLLASEIVLRLDARLPMLASESWIVHGVPS